MAALHSSHTSGLGLTAADCDLLIEACDAWVKKDEAGLLLGSFVEDVILRDPISRAEYAQRMSGHKANQEAERRGRAEVAILLKAKLLLLRDELRRREDLATYPEEVQP